MAYTPGTGAGIKPLATITGINLFQKGQVKLYQIPAGESLLLLGCYLTVLSSTGVFKTPLISLGREDLPNDVCPPYRMNSVADQGKSIDLSTVKTPRISTIVNDKKWLVLDIIEAGEGVTMSARIDIFGFLV